MSAVGDWIERVYNRRRRHSAPKLLSPVRFEELQPPGRAMIRHFSRYSGAHVEASCTHFLQVKVLFGINSENDSPSIQCS